MWVTLWASPVFRKATEWAGICLLALFIILGVRHHWFTQGVERGTQQESQAAAANNLSDHKVDHDTTTPQLQELTNAIKMLAQQAANDRQIMIALTQQRQQVAQQVQGMTPQQLQDAINAALGHPAGTTEFTLEDKRKALSCFEQLPRCDQQVQTAMAELTKDENALAKQDARYAALAGYTGRTEQAYYTLYNDKVKPVRKFTHWLWLKKVKPVVPAPDPKELFAAKPQ